MSPSHTAFLRTGPASARVVMALVGELGEATLHIALAIPDTAAASLLTATGMLSAHYLAVLDFTRDTLYEGISGSRTLAVGGIRFLTSFSTTIEDASRTALGRAALVWNGISSVPIISKLAAAPSVALGGGWGEQTALFTYTTINNFFDSAGRSLVSLFIPAPTIVLP